MAFQSGTPVLDPSRDRPIPAALYRITSRGFFSEFNILTYACAHSLEHGRTLFVDVAPGAGPWRELFSPFPKPGSVLSSNPRFHLEMSLVSKLETGTWNPDWVAMREAVRDACLEKRWVKAPLAGFEGPYDEFVVAVARKLFRPVASLNARAEAARQAMGLYKVPFSAVQLRRGDKVHGYQSPKGKWVVETEIAPFAAYAECLAKMAPDIRDVFVISDDYTAFEEARAEFPQYRFHTLCDPSERGYIHADQQAASDETKLANLQKLLVTVMIARDSQAFVGTYFSNLSIGVYLLHRHRSRCVSMDLGQPWPPRDPWFMPGRDEI
jgi:hypothetical protein